VNVRVGRRALLRYSACRKQTAEVEKWRPIIKDTNIKGE
jgi:hypothetical protein